MNSIFLFISLFSVTDSKIDFNSILFGLKSNSNEAKLYYQKLKFDYKGSENFSDRVVYYYSIDESNSEAVDYITKTIYKDNKRKVLAYQTLNVVNKNYIEKQLNADKFYKVSIDKKDKHVTSMFLYTKKDIKCYITTGEVKNKNNVLVKVYEIALMNF